MFHLRTLIAPPLLSLAVLLAFGGIAPAGAKSPEEFLGEAPADKPETKGKPQDKKVRATSKSASSADALPPMDTARIHNQYLEGEFDQAIRALEAQLKSKKPMTHAESVFVFKHLGVMYAAQHSTRDKGKHYMLELISIEPTAKILDMYASDMIHLIFRNVQEEFEKNRRRLADKNANGDATAASAVAPASSPATVAGSAKSSGEPGRSRSSSNRRRNVLLATAGVGVAVGALTLFLVLGEDEPKTRTIVVNE